MSLTRDRIASQAFKDAIEGREIDCPEQDRPCVIHDLRDAHDTLPDDGLGVAPVWRENLQAAINHLARKVQS